MHILFTCLRASGVDYERDCQGGKGGMDAPKLSRALRTISNVWNHCMSYCGSFMFPWMGFILTLGLNGAAVCAAI